MYAIEFEADIKEGIVKIPDKYSRLKNTHARVVLLIEEPRADQELKEMSNHSASTIEEWRSPDEDDIWT